MKTRAINRSNPEFAQLARTILQCGAALRFTAAGQSMAPCIREGDILTVCPIHRNELKTGHIVACIRPDSDTLFVHRIIAKTHHGFVLQGDNRYTTDGVFQAEHILGRVIRIRRQGKSQSFGLGWEQRIIAVFLRWGGRIRSGGIVYQFYHLPWKLLIKYGSTRWHNIKNCPNRKYGRT